WTIRAVSHDIPLPAPPHPALPTVDSFLGRFQRQFAALTEVEAIALSGSRARASAPADPASDVDLYVFTSSDISLATRQRIVAQLGGAPTAQLDQRFWGLSDQWIDPASGLHIDVNYFDAGWMQDSVVRVVEAHQASLGYTTCFWRTIQQSRVLFDRASWLAELKARCLVAYPDALRRNIIAHNQPVLRSIYTSYAAQIAKAVTRGDRVSVNHRIAALLASYFDCLFAANGVLHPGEKRLVEFALANCRWLPPRMADDIAALLHAAAADEKTLAARIRALLDGLDVALALSPVTTADATS
ncbi:MAG TPA: DUF4037 domain-containing protein, partial [Gemmatimonadaceae bacterium]|nr:DUF4037 domain-containing protein [Gemmatimonadaceae bacterium]